MLILFIKLKGSNPPFAHSLHPKPPPTPPSLLRFHNLPLHIGPRVVPVVQEVPEEASPANNPKCKPFELHPVCRRLGQVHLFQYPLDGLVARRLSVCHQTVLNLVRPKRALLVNIKALKQSNQLRWRGREEAESGKRRVC